LAPCIRHIVSAMPKKDDRVNFNKLVMILVNYCQAVGWDKADVWDTVRDFIESYPHSETYDTSEKRLAHFKMLWTYLQDNPNYSFSCSRVLGLHLPGSAFECGGCLGRQGVNHQQEDALEEDPMESMVLSLNRLNLTDLGNAERFARDHSGGVKFCHEWGSWFIWDGKYWKRDTTALIK
jgi:hypothetical protein